MVRGTPRTSSCHGERSFRFLSTEIIRILDLENLFEVKNFGRKKKEKAVSSIRSLDYGTHDSADGRPSTRPRAYCQPSINGLSVLDSLAKRKKKRARLCTNGDACGWCLRTI